ncbi:MAG: hypothetical protein HRT87_00220 [Legionellales bacterium]|nr:hypothetical protein [Legionellales bacterium]
MVDQIKQEDEYHFQDLGQVEEEEPPKKGMAVFESFNMLDARKKIFVAAGAAFVLVVTYNIIVGLFSSKKPKPSKMSQANQLKKPVSTNSNRINSRVKPTIIPRQIQQPKVTTSNTTDNVGMKSQQALDNLNRSLQSIEIAIKDLDSRITDLQVNQSSMQKEFKESKPVVIPKKEPKKVVKKKIIKEPYNIIGVIHGRAWLQNNKGNAFTVKIGDKLKGYGKVKLIEPEQGVVITSSGDVLRFKEN